MSIEIKYLLKKAAYFRRRQFLGLILIAFGVPLLFVTILFVPTPTLQNLTHYPVWLIVAGVSLISLGVVITVYNSWKLSLFVVQWSKVMEEMEKKVKEIGG